MTLNGPPQDKEGNKKDIDYLKVLSSIEKNNGRLRDIANKLLKRPELLKLVPAKLDSDLQAHGINSISISKEDKIIVKGIRINPQNMSEEISVHELIHFFSMPALKSGFDREKENRLNDLPDNIKSYWLKTKALWDYATSKGYESTNTSSVHNSIVEFAVNFTNMESEEKLKKLSAYNALVDAFFEYYNSLGIREVYQNNKNRL